LSQKNGYADRITLIKGKVEDVVLPSAAAPDGTVDVIVSEWMGYLLLFESMLPTVLVARDRWLSSSGVLFPDSAAIYVCGIDDSSLYQRKISFWDDVYGFNMDIIKPHPLVEPVVELMNPKAVVSNHCLLKHIDISSVASKELEFTSAFTLRPTRVGKVHALVIWFSTGFPGTARDLTTSPEAEPTHWKQTALLLDPPLIIAAGGGDISGTCVFARGESNEREYIVTLTCSYEGTKQSRDYHMAC